MLCLLNRKEERRIRKPLSVWSPVFDSKGKYESPLHPVELSVITNTISAMVFFLKCVSSELNVNYKYFTFEYISLLCLYSLTFNFLYPSVLGDSLERSITLFYCLILDQQ